MPGRIPGSRRYVVALLALAMTISANLALAAPPLTLISDVLYKADGTRFDGVAFIEWKSFESADTSNLPMQSITLRITYGVVRVQLVPTTNATPGAYYRVRYNSNGLTQFTEYWAVPPSNVALRLRDVRIQGPLGGSSLTPPVNTAILIPDVSGLREELDARPIKGAGYSSSRVAMINADGAIESVLGNLSDCVKVDGTSGACATGGGTGPVFVDAETPAGAVDGSNGSFTLTGSPSPAASLQLFRNGILQKATVDFTLSGSSITFAGGSIPQSGDVIQTYYRK
jgi:hypothetical protein